MTRLQTKPPTMISAITIGNSVWAWAVMASEIGVTPSRPKAVTNRDWNPFNAPCAAEEPIPKIRKPTMVLMVPAITFSAGFLWISRPTMAMSPIRSDASPKMS